MNATLVRLEHNETETLGVLLLDGRMQAVTLELPWRQNFANISCIPEGIYRCSRRDSPTYGSGTWYVEDVPLRSNIILGHKGNTRADTEGCILLGMEHGKLLGDRAVLSSEKACAAFQVATSGISEMLLQVVGITFRQWARRAQA